MLQLRLHLGGQLGSGEIGPGLLVVLEGRDAGGKGGAIAASSRILDPRHYTVRSYSAPTPDEKRHHFLRRFFRDPRPRRDVRVRPQLVRPRVVERPGGYATDEQWERAYVEIVEFERTLVLEGLILVKFWLHISDEEQLGRLAARQADPLKRWKLTEEDWRNRSKNSRYDEAAEDVFARTDHGSPPWDSSPVSRSASAAPTVLERLNQRIEAGMRRYGRDVPPEPETFA